MRTIDIVVSPQGESRVETKGFSGNECQKASDFIAKALGKATQERLKSEFYTQTETEGLIEQKS